MLQTRFGRAPMIRDRWFIVAGSRMRSLGASEGEQHAPDRADDRLPRHDASHHVGGIRSDRTTGGADPSHRADRCVGLLRCGDGRARAVGARRLRGSRWRTSGAAFPHADERARNPLLMGSARSGLARRRSHSARGGGSAQSSPGRSAIPRPVSGLRARPLPSRGRRASRAAADHDLRPHDRPGPGSRRR